MRQELVIFRCCRKSVEFPGIRPRPAFWPHHSISDEPGLSFDRPDPELASCGPPGTLASTFAGKGRLCSRHSSAVNRGIRDSDPRRSRSRRRTHKGWTAIRLRTPSTKRRVPWPKREAIPGRRVRPMDCHIRHPWRPRQTRSRFGQTVSCRPILSRRRHVCIPHPSPFNGPLDWAGSVSRQIPYFSWGAGAKTNGIGPQIPE